MGDEPNLEALLGPDTCRLCLKTGRSPTPVSNENLQGSLMAIKIDILTSVKVAPSDKVCPMCRINVKNFYDFRIMCVQSDARIKGFAAKVATSQDLSVIKSDQVVRSYKRVRRAGEGGPTGETIKPLNDSVQGAIDLFRSTADLFKKAESGNYSGGLFRLKTKSVLMRTEDAFKGIKRPLTSSEKQSTESPQPAGCPQKSAVEPRKSTQNPALSPDDPLMATDKHRSSPEDSNSLDKESVPLSSARDPLSLATDPLSSALDPLSSATDPLSSAEDSLSRDEETLNITVEPLICERDDIQGDLETEQDRSPSRIAVKIEDTREDDSISDAQSDHYDNVDSDRDSVEECETEIDTNKPSRDEFVGEESALPIKKELPDYESSDDVTDISRNVESMDDLRIKPEEVIIPEMKREPGDDLELCMETECEDTEDYSRDGACYSEQSVEPIKKEPELSRDDTESLEVLVDPLMLMDDDHDAQMTSKLSRLSPVLGNGMSIKNGKLPLPQLNGARSDKQRGLDFVKHLLRQNDKPREGQSAGGENSDRPYRCALCDLTFSYHKSYMKHKERHLGVQTIFSCNICTANFQTNRELYVHMRKHVEKAFSCDRCYRSFPSKDRLSAHYYLHTGDKPYICDLCKKSFAYKSSFVYHMRRQHGEVITGGTYLRCPKCPTEWNTPAELTQHMEMHDSEEMETTTFSCPICSMSFPSKSILNVHARIHQKSLK